MHRDARLEGEEGDADAGACRGEQRAAIARELVETAALLDDGERRHSAAPVVAVGCRVQGVGFRV